jgi:beta-glucosidase
MPPQKIKKAKLLSSILIAILIVLPFGFMLIWQKENPELRWDWNKIDTSDVRFPKAFLWGVATAAHQVEGHCDNNNWSAWEQARDEYGKPRVKNGQKAGLACDHWNRYPEDISLMQALCVKAYRFSVEWSKIEPREGEFDQAALQHYQELCEALLVAGLKPVVTLHHFTQPIWFEQKGGFEKAENIALWVRFCEIVFQKLQDKVHLWCTINEPEVFASQGYFQGVFPPGKKDPQLAGAVLKNLLEAHVQVYHALKRLPNGDKAQIGLAKNIFQFDPYRRWHLFDWLVSRQFNALFTDAIIRFFQTGHFDFSLPGLANVTHFNAAAPRTLDFIGLNYYSHMHVKFHWNLKEFFTFEHRADEIMTDMPYPIYAEGFYRAIKTVAQLGVPIYITENGIADAKDDRRDLFIRRYLFALSEAIKDSCDVRGYFYWSLMDNFEWAEGYDMKFGLYEVNFATQDRKLREGARYFVEVVNKQP